MEDKKLKNNNLEEGKNGLESPVESPQESGLSEEERKEKELDTLYEGLNREENKVKQFEQDQEKIVELQKGLGMDSSFSAPNSDILKKFEATQKKVLELEQDFMGIPENAEKTSEEKISDFQNTEAFIDAQKEMDEQSKILKEEYIKKTSDEMMEKYRDDFSRAKNGEKAEILFRKKFNLYFNKAFELVDKGEKGVVTFVDFHFVTLKNPEGEDFFYVEKIDMENKIGYNGENRVSGIGEDKDKGKENEENIKKLESNKDIDSELVGSKEKNEIERLKKKDI